MCAIVCRFLIFTLTALSPLAATAGPGPWEVLFDGSGVSAWKSYQRADDTPLAWVVEGGALAWRKGCGHLISRKAYGDFELELEWRISPAGNSGIVLQDHGNPVWFRKIRIRPR